jgi:soluble lytic murein transglycosylase-like protein
MLTVFFIVSIFIQIESGGRNINGDGGQSIGIMQVRVKTAKFILNKTKLKEPENIKTELSKIDYNMKIGILLLNYLLYKNNSFVAFINSYNTGNYTKLKHDKNHVYYKRFEKTAGFLKILAFNLIFSLKKEVFSVIMITDYFLN